jgi:sodium/proline symporter
VTDRLMLRASRIITILIGGVGLVIAIWSDKLIFAMVSYAWAGLGSSFGPLLLLMLKWKKVTWQGAIAGLISGSLTTVVWSEIEWLDDHLSVRFVSFVLAFLAVWLVSLGTRRSL